MYPFEFFDSNTSPNNLDRTTLSFKRSETISSPSCTDVICARGRVFWDHEGNRRYRALIAQATREYAGSNCKLEKSLLVSEIIEAIRRSNGRFIKREKRGGRWVEADEGFAREKVGQSLRDGLVAKYKSATKAKRERRSKLYKTCNGDVDRVIRSNLVVAKKINDLLDRVEETGRHESDQSLGVLFLQTNLSILESIKQDGSLLTQFREAIARGESDHTTKKSTVLGPQYEPSDEQQTRQADEDRREQDCKDILWLLEQVPSQDIPFFEFCDIEPIDKL